MIRQVELYDFVKWLEGPQRVVGRAQKPCSCPVACYMRDKYGDEYSFRVGAAGIAALKITDPPGERRNKVVYNRPVIEKIIRKVDDDHYDNYVLNTDVLEIVDQVLNDIQLEEV